MSIVVVAGGQFGGEGKGKITAHLCRTYNFDVAVRCGGPNSGHTVTIDDKQVVLRQIPAGVVNPNTKLFLAAGCLIDMNVLLEEMQLFNLTPDRLKIDGNAVMIDEKDIEEEKEVRLNNRIGSTCSGVGAAVAKRVFRKESVKLVKDVPELTSYVTRIPKEVMAYHENKKRIVIEGTQGFGLSVYHSPYYPYATSRDTTASAFLSEVGISPLVVSDIIMVTRTFPIRVGGNSGPLLKETDWETIQLGSGYPYKIQEHTTVTNRLRRVGRFDLETVEKANAANKPTHIALMGVDYLDYKNKGIKNYRELTNETKDFISWLGKKLEAKISFIGTGPTDYEIIDSLEKQKNEQKGIESDKLIELSMSRAR